MAWGWLQLIDSRTDDCINFIQVYEIWSLVMESEEGRNYKPPDSIVCVSRASKASILMVFEQATQEINREFNPQVCYRGKVGVIPLCVDTEKFRPREEAPLRSPFGIPKDEIPILQLGKL